MSAHTEQRKLAAFIFNPNKTTYMHPTLRTLNLLLLASLIILAANGSHAAAAPIVLKVDARDVNRRVLHATLQIPAQPGPLTLVYPKWIPGEHGPTGPITDLTGLKMSAGGEPIVWKRDPLDNYAFQLIAVTGLLVIVVGSLAFVAWQRGPLDNYVFQVQVPTGVNAVDVSLDFLLPSDPNGFTQAASSSANLVVISWNTVLLYPKGAAGNAVDFAARLQLPAGWKFASALPRRPAAITSSCSMPLRGWRDAPGTEPLWT